MTITVEYVNGPLHGETCDLPAEYVLGEDPGAYMIVDGRLTPPGRPDLRAVYEPHPGAEPSNGRIAWHFNGWIDC
ncbi:hypothetical protein [Marinitenerispora sediminis]|nr:hypothetical protein [Marinitenerispora sediminis]